jgi:hypothetical protein
MLPKGIKFFEMPSFYFMLAIENVSLKKNRLRKALGHGLQGNGTYYSGKSPMHQITGERMLATRYSQGVGAISLYPAASGLELVMGHNQGGSEIDRTYHRALFLITSPLHRQKRFFMDEN